jgi:N-acetylmuramoyl-L-alanine amidase
MTHPELSDQQVLALTAYMEADSMGWRGMTATLNTVQNRLSSGVVWWGKSHRDICLKPWQYSCWNADNKRLAYLLSKLPVNDMVYSTSLALARLTLSGTLGDVTGGATHYVNHELVRPLPKWAAGAPLYKLEPHWYYRVVT